MPTETQDVKPESSPGSVKDGSQPSDELAKIKADNERLKSVVNTLQSERDEVRDRLDKFEEIEKRRELSAREEAERRKLERKEDNIDDQIDELRRKPEAKPWFTHLERELTKLKGIAANEALTMMAADSLERFARQLSKEEDFKGMTDEKLWKLIKPYASQFDSKSPVLRVEYAYEAWKDAEAFKKEKAEAAKKKAEAENTREDGSRIARESSTEDLMNKKGDLSHADKSALREKLGIMQRSR